MVTIELQQLRFHAFHGLYAGEEKTGSPYEVNVRVIYEEGSRSLDNLENTVNYVEVFNIVKQRMLQPAPLLETVAEHIIRDIKERFSFVREVEVSLFKLEPPVPQFQGRLGITMHKQFNG
jgi:dihydroneopterin aldolase